MLKTKEEQLLTAGEFARLAQTTKRTVHWYTELGLLKPKKINSKGYKFYSVNQIIDLQVIMLLRDLDFSLPEIKRFLRKNSSPRDLFQKRKKFLEAEINKLQAKMRQIDQFSTNLNKLGFLVNPKVKNISSFESFVIEKVGPYSAIYDYLAELKNQFSTIPKGATYFVLFPDREYAPKKDRLVIGVIATADMKLKAETYVRARVIPAFKALNYRHIGSPALISMLIMQMHEFMDIKGIKQDLQIPINELEFYRNSALNGNLDENTMISEINIPISS